MNIPTEKNTTGLSAEQLANLGANNLVYVREVLGSQIRAEIGASQNDVDQTLHIPITDDQRLYAIHLANGTRVAVLDSREAAFFAARQHDMHPVSVH